MTRGILIGILLALLVTYVAYAHAQQYVICADGVCQLAEETLQWLIELAKRGMGECV